MAPAMVSRARFRILIVHGTEHKGREDTRRNGKAFLKNTMYDGNSQESFLGLGNTIFVPVFAERDPRHSSTGDTSLRHRHVPWDIGYSLAISEVHP